MLCFWSSSWCHLVTGCGRYITIETVVFVRLDELYIIIRLLMLTMTWKHISSPNPIKIVHTKSLKQYKTIFKFQNLSYYSNICSIKKCYICQYWPRKFSTGILSNFMQAKTSFKVYNSKTFFTCCRVYNCSIYILDKNNNLDGKVQLI